MANEFRNYFFILKETSIPLQPLRRAPCGALYCSGSDVTGEEFKPEQMGKDFCQPEGLPALHRESSGEGAAFLRERQGWEE